MTLTLFVVLAVIATLAGGLIPSIKAAFSRVGMSRLFAVRAGILLGVAFTEILPEAWELNPVLAGWAAVGAFVLLFAIANFAMLDSCGEYLEQCRVHYLSWTALFALTTHSFIDGFNLSVSFAAGERAGVAVGLALALHKVADGFTLTSLFAQSGFGPRKSLGLLLLVTAATPLAALLSSPAVGVSSLPAPLEASLLGFAAGSFVYIAATDVLPRLHKKADRASVLFFISGLLGIAALRLH